MLVLVGHWYIFFGEISSLPILKSGRFFVVVVVVFVLIFYQLYALQIFSPIPWIAFHSRQCPLVHKSF